MLVFVDCEARGPSPVSGTLTEFGCVAYPKMQTFHGRLFVSAPDPSNPAIPIVGKRLHSDLMVARWLTLWLSEVSNGERVVMVSDNPAYDYMWITPDTAELRAPDLGDLVVINRDERGIVHGCPPDGSGLTPCCQRTPFELPRYDRLTIDPKQVTCGE